MSTDFEKKKDLDLERDDEAIFPVASKVQGETKIIHDDVFGEISEDGPNYRSLSWPGAAVLMMKTQIGLGVLSIPSAFDALGMIPGIICLIAVASITSWSNYMVGVIKMNHPEVYAIDDVGKLLFGRIGREVFGVAYALYWICVGGSGMLGISICLNSLSTHGACTAIFLAVACIIGFSLSSIQTLNRISWLTWVGLAGILTAIFTLTVSVGIQDRPADAPREGDFKADYKLFASPTFAEASAALSSLVFAYAGTPGFFNIISEMREPQYYTRALIICQGTMTSIYLSIGIVVYYFCGSYVASPALGSAGTLMKKVCYGLALPGLVMTTVLVTHFAAKYFFLRLLRGSEHLSRNTFKHWISWLGCTGGCAIIAYIIASAVPVFGGLVSLIGALLGTLMSFQPYGAMWLFDNWSAPKKALMWKLMAGFSIFVIVSGTFLMVAGTYGSIEGIIASYKANGGTAAWTCADNSNSV